MNVIYDNDFDFSFPENERVFQIVPDVFGDQRGSFTEVYTTTNEKCFKWFNDPSWIKQINRSSSVPNVCRGMHAQIGKSCQSKFVECINGKILDFILDARPNSKTFGKFKSYLLDSKKANKLFIPIGFLHGFYSIDAGIDQNIFQYIVGGAVYDKKAECSVNIKSVLERYVDCNSLNINVDKLILSEKDLNSIGLDNFLCGINLDWHNNHILWYK